MPISNNMDLTITHLSGLIRRRKLSPVELTLDLLARIERLDVRLNSYITITSDLALAQAHRAEKEIVRGDWRGPLHGIPICLKDLFHTRGVRTTAGSRILRNLPGLLYLLAALGNKLAGNNAGTMNIFKCYSGSLLPMGLLLWVAFVIPMLFANFTFIEQSLSDPFGWGWDFFGTANTPWHQFLPRYIPWFQALLVLAGLHYCLRNLKITLKNYQVTGKEILLISLPFTVFITSAAVCMLFFFTN